MLTEDWGVQGDAHAGKSHRQVSLLGLEQIEAFRLRGSDLPFGAFGENLVIEGFRPKELPVGTVLRIGNALLEMTQIGKECHGHCAIYRETGDCIMPREGVFARVLRGGSVRPGDSVVVLDYKPI
ncbi:MAG: MOSC domain-containing protein [Oscillospiraceae bacterium]|nr:MOSC domain-containing protein [Oscillospiraceae bacterium]